MPALTPLPVAYATATAEGVAALVGDCYALPGPIGCDLLYRGFNDTYMVRSGTGTRHILRISGDRARGAADVAAETAFLAWLDAQDVPVAAAVPGRDGALFRMAALPQGARAAVLFQHVEGRRPELDEPDDARLQGITLARLHDAAEANPDRAAGRYRLDLDHLLHRQVVAVAALGLDAAALATLRAVAARLDAGVRGLAALSWTRCHGDVHGLNARIATTGRWAGHAVFFDFDDGGFGYLAYDLAVHLWAQVSFGRRRHAIWLAFMAGYVSQRPVQRADEAAIPLFVAIRHIWLMGEFASRTAEWGTEVLSAAWLTREVAFLLAWERQRLSPTLL